MACDKLSYLLLRPGGFRMYCDHRNLIHVFAPGHEVKKHIRGKLLRWAMKLMEYRYSIEHIDGVRNVWADMVSRWAGHHQEGTVTVRRVGLERTRAETRADTVSGTKNSPAPSTTDRVAIRPFKDSDFVWPTIEDLQRAQTRHVTEKPKGLRVNHAGLWCDQDRIWVPDADRHLVQRLLVIAHCGPQCHRGREALLTVMNRRFSIRGLTAMVKTFLAGCLMCQHVKGGKVVNRPWAETFRSSERNGALHWDYIHLGESYGGDKNLLVLKDDATHYCELVPCGKPTGTVTTEAILDWHSRFGAPRV